MNEFLSKQTELKIITNKDKNYINYKRKEITAKLHFLNVNQDEKEEKRKKK